MTPLIFPKTNNSVALRPLYAEAESWNRIQARSIPEASSSRAPQLVFAGGQSNVGSATVNMSATIDRKAWNREAQKLFHALVEKKALGEATEEDHKELRYLQTLRREAEEQIAPEQVLAELRRERAIQEIIVVLERYSVEFGPLPTVLAPKG
jgi:hypothetical protein